MTFDEAVALLLRENDVPGEWVEGWYCSGVTGLHKSPVDVFNDDASAVRFVQNMADNGSAIHQAAIYVATLVRMRVMLLPW